MKISQLKSEWEKGKQWVDNYTRDFPELDNLADGVPTNASGKAPSVGSATLAGAVRDIPRSSVQQMPTFSAEVNGTTTTTDAIVVDFLLRRVVFNEDTFGNGILPTIQMGAQSALTRGFQPFIADTGRIFNEFGTVLRAVHYDDIVIEPGVFDASDSSYYMVRTRATKGKLEKILKAAKKNPNTSWNVKALTKLLQSPPEVYSDSGMTSEPRSVGLNNTAQYEIITRYGVGPYYSVHMFTPNGDDILMSYESKSKFGYPRMSFLVIDPTQLSPFGVSRARLASPMAKYANIYLQSTAKTLLINADPPTLKKGMFTTPTPYRRGVQWETADPNADVVVKSLETSALQQYESVLRFADNNILSLMGLSSTTAPTVNSAYQNVASVEARNVSQDLSSKQVSMILENMLRQYALTALDLYVSEQVGTSALIVDDEAKHRLNRANPPEFEGQPEFVGDDNVVEVDWEGLYDRIETWTVKVDLSIAKSDLKEQELAQMQDVATNIRQQANPDDPQSMARVNAIEDKLIQETMPDIAQTVQAQQHQTAVDTPIQ